MRLEASHRRGRESLPQSLPALQAGNEDGLAILPVVLWTCGEPRCQAALLGHALFGALCKSSLHREGAHAVHALLPLVPAQGPARLEDRGGEGPLRGLWLGRAPRLLGPLRVVWSFGQKAIGNVDAD